MTYPPPPGLVILAYQFGSISKTEMIRLIRMWHEKHEEDDVMRWWLERRRGEKPDKNQISMFDGDENDDD